VLVLYRLDNAVGLLGSLSLNHWDIVESTKARETAPLHFCLHFPRDKPAVSGRFIALRRRPLPSQQRRWKSTRINAKTLL
jgi:hypothetical protein